MVQKRPIKTSTKVNYAFVWMIDTEFTLVYANEEYLNFTEEVTGKKPNLQESVFTTYTSANNSKRWKAYYKKALEGSSFEVSAPLPFLHKKNTSEFQIQFQPITNSNNEVIAVNCNSIINHEAPNLHELVNASLDVFCTINDKGNFIYVSDAAEKHWGYSADELLNKPYANYIIDEDLAKTDEIAAQILNGKNITTFKNRYKKKDGSIAYNIWSARWDNETKLMYCVARDGKEHREKEQILLKSEHRFKSLVQDGGDMISIIDLQGNYTYTSPTTTSILGISPDEFYGKNIADFIHPDDIAKTSKYLERIVSEKKIIVEPFQLKDGNNNWRWIESVITNMLDNPDVEGIVANSRDITDRINEEQRLKLLETVITNTKDSVLITEAEPFDEPGPKIIYVNEAFTEMTGYTAEEVIGKTPRILQGPKSDFKALAKLSKAIRNWESYEVTTINYKKNGDEFWINFSVTPVKDEKGWYTHWIAIERDVTEQQNKIIEKDLLSEISSLFNQETALSIAGDQLCNTLANFGNFDLVELWIPDLSETQIQLYSHFLKKETDAIFYEISKEQRHFKLNEDLPGNVWQDKKTITWKDLSNFNKFLRKNAAKEIGLKAIMGIPLMHDHKIIGVLVLGSKSSHTQLKNSLSIFKKLETFVGAELYRKKLETNLSRLYNSVPELISSGDFNGNFLEINQAGCNMLGYEKHEIIGSSFVKFMHPDDVSKSYEELKELESGKETINFEVRFITKQSSIIWLSWICTPNFKEGIIYSTAKNITQEKNLKELNRQVGKMAKIGSWEMVLDNSTLYWSDEVHKIHGTDPKNFTPTLQNSLAFYKEEYAALVKNQLDFMITNDGDNEFEAVVINTANQEVWVKVIGKSEFIDGKCVRIYGSLQDITEKKEADLRLESLANNLPGVVFKYIIAPDGKDHLQYVSDGALKTWGLIPKEVVANNQLVWERIALGGELEKVQQSIEKSISSKTNWTCQWKYIMPNGEKRTHLGYGTPNFLTDGSIVFNSVILDISQEVKTQELLEDMSSLAKIGSWELNLENNELFWSEEVHKIHGTESSTFQPMVKDAINYYKKDYREIIQMHLDACINNNKNYDFEAVIITADKKEKWVRSQGQAEFTSDGKCLRIFGSLQDITEKKETEERMKALADNLPGVVFQYVLHTDGTNSFRMVNNGAKIIWGFTPEEVTENSQLVWNQISLSGELEKVQNSFDLAIQNDTDWTCQWNYVMPSGEKKTHRGYGSYNTLADGTVIYNALILDITAQAKSEELLDEVSRLAKIGSWEMDLVNDKVFWSNEVHKIHETDPNNFKPQLNDAIQFYRKDFQEKVKESVEDCINNNTENDIEAIIITANNKEKWVRAQGKAEYVNGKCIRVYGSLQDINDKKQAEIALQLSESKFRTIFEIASLGIIQVNPLNGQILLVNSYYEAITGYTQEELLTKNFKDLTHPDDQEKDWELFKKAANQEQEYKNEKRYIKKDGSIVWVRIHLAFIRDKNNNPIRTVAICEDINDRKEVELRLNSLSNNLPGVVFQYIIHNDGTNSLLHVTEGAKNIWGFSPNEIIPDNQKVWDRIALGGELEKLEESIEKSVASKDNWTCQWKYIMPNGERKTHLGYGSPNFMADGSVVFNSVILDVTKEVKNEELLEEVSNLAKIGSWEFDLKTQKLFWSKQVHQLHGTNANTYVPDVATAINFYREDFRDMVSQQINNAITKGENWNFEAVLITKQNQELWVRAIGEPEIVDGECIRLYGSFQDINALKETETRIHHLSSNLPGVIYQYVLYPDGKDTLKHVGGNVKEMWGFTPEEVLGDVNLVWQQIDAAGDLEIAKNTVLEAIKTKSKWNGRFRYKLPSGEIRLHLGNGTPSYLADGSIIFNSIILDITQEVKNEELLNMATQLSRIGSWEMELQDPTNNNMYWSPMIKEILEVDEKYNANLSGGLEFYTENSNIKINEAMAALIEKGIEFDEELLLITAKGNERWVRAIGKSERIKNKCVKIYGSLQDIHQTKILDLRLSDILNSISDAFYAVDKNWNFTYFNKEAERLLNKKEKEVLGKNIWNLFPAAKSSPLFKIYKKVTKNQTSESFEYFYPGDHKWYEVSVYTSLDGLSVYFKNIDERKKAEQELLKAFQEKQGILESIGDGFLSVKKDWTVTYWNQAAEKLTGIDKEDILGRYFWDTYKDAIDTDFYTYYVKAMETGEKVTFEEYYHTLDTWFEVNVYPNKEGLSAYFKDIGYRKQAEIEKNRLQATLESSLNEIYIFDQDTLTFSYANQSALTNLGYTLEELKEFSPIDIKPGYTKKSFKKLIQPLIKKQEKKIIFYTEHQRKDNTTYPVQIQLQLVKEGNKNTFLALTLNITELKLADEKIIAANERFQKVTEATKDAIWDWDIVNDNFYRSDAIKHFFGAASNLQFSKDNFWQDNFHPEDLPKIKNKITEFTNDPTCNRWEMDYRIINQQGDICYVIDRGIVSRDNNGKAIRMVGSMSDVTEEKKMTIELNKLNQDLKNYANDLERSNEELEQFAFITSHDLQEPLRMVSSFMDQLKRKYGDQLDDKALQYIHFATDGAKRMKQIILDLLEYSRAGRPLEGKEKFNVTTIIEEYKKLRRKVILEKSVEITHNKLPFIDTYKVAIIQILHALLDNAIKYSKKDETPKIDISVTESRTEWIFAIKDNGIGIDEKFFDKIFIIFQRLHNRDEFEGTGIGLSITKKHVESLGGKIWLTSKVGVGTTIYFSVLKKNNER